MNDPGGPDMLDGSRDVATDACNCLRGKRSRLESVIKCLSLDELPGNVAHAPSFNRHPRVLDEIGEVGMPEPLHRADLTLNEHARVTIEGRSVRYVAWE